MSGSHPDKSSALEVQLAGPQPNQPLVALQGVVTTEPDA